MTATSTAVDNRRQPPVSRNRVRSRALDAIRGLAIALMLLDHLALLTGAPHVIRETVTRLSMPLFFIVSGHLVHRLSWRHAGALVCGLALPIAVPWVDHPNVLCWYVAGATALVLSRQWQCAWFPVVAVAVALGGYANRYDVHSADIAHSYVPGALLGLMALGAMLPRSSFSWGDRLPRCLAVAGRYPLSIYVGHLLVLQVLFFGGLG